MKLIQALSKYTMHIDIMTSRMKQYNVINMGVRVEIWYLAWHIVNVYKAIITQV